MAMTKKGIRPVRFTPDNLLRVQQLAAAGLSSIEIAKSLGSTPASVKNVCCRNKIKIPRRRRSIKNALIAHLPVSFSTEFHRKAEELQIAASVLASTSAGDWGDRPLCRSLSFRATRGCLLLGAKRTFSGTVAMSVFTQSGSRASDFAVMHNISIQCDRIA